MRRTALGPYKRAIAQRIAEESEYVTESGCLIWTGTWVRFGYGVISIGNAHKDGALVRAHRAAWEIAFGPIPDGLIVCHKCDCPPCINPQHLFLGTKRDNALDACRKGRNPMGEKHGRALLTQSDVAAIRTSKESVRAAGLRFGVCKSTVSFIRRRETWKRA